MSQGFPPPSGIPNAEVIELRKGVLTSVGWEDMESIAFLRMFLARGELLFADEP